MTGYRKHLGGGVEGEGRVSSRNGEGRGEEGRREQQRHLSEKPRGQKDEKT